AHERVQGVIQLGSSLLRDIRCKSAKAFPCASANSSATSKRSSRRAFSSLRRASSPFDASLLRPLGRPFKPSNPPSSRCCRHLVISDEYRPSRLKTRPTPPRSVTASSSRKICSLYFALNRRATTTSDDADTTTDSLMLTTLQSAL